MALVAAVCVVATGCLSGEVEVVVNGDGSGRVVVEVLPEGPLADALRSVELERLVELSAEGVRGTEFETFERAGRVGYRLTIDFDDADGAVQALQRGVTIVGQPVQLLGSGELRKLPDGGGWELTAQVVPAGKILTAPTGDATGNAAAAGLAALVQAASAPDSGSGLNLSISLPGHVTESNADSVSGGTATWRLDEPEAPTELRVRTEPDPFPLPMRLAAGAAALVVLAVVALIVRRARRRRGEAAPAQQPPQPPPSMMPPGQPEWAPVPNGWAPPTPAPPVPPPAPNPAAPVALADLPPPTPTPPPPTLGAPTSLADLPPPVPHMPPPVPAPPRSTLPVLPPLEPLEPAQAPPEPPPGVDSDAV